MRLLYNLARDERGAVTIDWVGITASLLLLGMAVVYAIYGSGVASATGLISDTLNLELGEIDPGPLPDLNP